MDSGPDANLTLLGEFSLTIGGRQVSLPSKGIELMALLALEPDADISRERLSGILWPDCSHERALGNLSTTLWRVRKAVNSSMPYELMATSSKGIALDKSKVRVDYWDFSFSIATLASSETSPSAAQAVALFRGDLLSGDCDAEWIVGAREKIRRLYVQALRLHGTQQAANGNVSEALGSYQLALDVDPLNEEMCREVMKLHYGDGRRTEALRVFASLRQRLRSELQVEPEIETSTLCRIIRDSQSGIRETLSNSEVIALAQTASQNVMVGRERELGELKALVSSVQMGSVVCIGVEGEIGIGKTRLVEDLRQSLGGRGYKVLWGRCNECPPAAPYSTVRELFSGASGFWEKLDSDFERRPIAISDLLQPQSELSSVGIELAEKFGDALDGIRRGPAPHDLLLLILEDVQFSDLASLDLLLRLTNHARVRGLVLILTWRSGDCPAPLSALLGSSSGVSRIVKLPRLTRPAIRELCRTRLTLPYVPESTVDFVYSQSEGNPLFAIECLRSLEGGPQVVPNGIFGQLRELPRLERGSVRVDAPDGIRSYIAARIESLSENARQILWVASACGRDVDADFIARVAKAPVNTILRRLEALVSSGFILVADVKFEFVHDRIRELCYQTIPVAVRLRLHRRVYDVLEAFFPDRLDALAFHSGCAGWNDRAASHWEQLGDRAAGVWAQADARTAYNTALSHLERIAKEVSIQHRRFRLLGKRAVASEHLGMLEEGSADVRRMREIAQEENDGLRSCEALGLESRFLLRRGRFSRALDSARLATDMARTLGERSLEARSLEIAGLAMYRLGDFPRAEQELLLLIEMLEKERDPEGLERAWNNLGRVQLVEGRKIQALESADKAERYETGNLHEKAMRTLLRGIAQCYLARGDEAFLDLQLAEKDFSRCGNVSGQAIANAYLSFCNVWRGDLGAAVLCGRRGLPFKAGRTDARWGWISATLLSYGLWFVLGNYRRAQREISQFLRADSTKGNPGLLLDTAAAIALEQGQLEAALSLAREAVERLSCEAGPAVGDALGTLGRVYLAMMKPDEALGPLRRAAVIHEEACENLTLPRILSALAEAELESASVEPAVEHSRRAVRLLAQNGDFGYLPQEVYWNHFLILRFAEDAKAPEALRKAYRLVMRLARQLGRKGKARFLMIRVNRQIVAAWEEMFGGGSFLQSREKNDMNAGLSDVGKVSVLVPVTGAPWGRPLRPGEYVEVIWTTDAGKPDQTLRELKGDVGLRRGRILRLCAEASVQGGDPREEDLARVLGVTTRTIRSDIAYLRAQGCHVQTRGANLH